MSYMNHLKVRPNNSVNKIRTTIGVRLATKNLILKHSRPGESFDDTIARIIKSYDRQQDVTERLEAILAANNIKEPNLIQESVIEERINDVITTQKGENLFFNYNRPILEFPQIEFYEMDIVITEPQKNRKYVELEELEFRDDDWIWIRFKMIERIINTFFDPGFEIHDKNRVLDPNYWKNVCSRVGLPNSSLERDILTWIRIYERRMNNDPKAANLYGRA